MSHMVVVELLDGSWLGVDATGENRSVERELETWALVSDDPDHTTTRSDISWDDVLAAGPLLTAVRARTLNVWLVGHIASDTFDGRSGRDGEPGRRDCRRAAGISGDRLCGPSCIWMVGRWTRTTAPPRSAPLTACTSTTPRSELRRRYQANGRHAPAHHIRLCVLGLGEGVTAARRPFRTMKPSAAGRPSSLRRPNSTNHSTRRSHTRSRKIGFRYRRAWIHRKIVEIIS
jgi:hypothetical protein